MDIENRSIEQRLEKLTPAQRELFEKRLMERRVKAAQEQTIPRRDGDGPAPLSYAQELLWLLSQVFDDAIAYNAPGSFQLEGPLDLELLQRAFDALVERHSILRTTYHVIDGRPMQVIGLPAPVEINLVDLRHLDSDEQQTESQRILAAESRFRFDLVNGPRSEEHTSELQSHSDLVCRLLLEKK